MKTGMGFERQTHRSRGRWHNGRSYFAERLEPRTLLSISLLADTNSEGAGSFPHNFVQMDGVAYFVADDGQHASELWRSNGTAAGTQLVKDINPTTPYLLSTGTTPLQMGASNPVALTAVNHTLFFFADDGVHGFELWKSDGTAAGTVMIKDIDPGPAGSNPVLYFGDSNSPLPQNISTAVLGGRFFFTVYNPDLGLQFWSSDGTDSGTAMLQQLTNFTPTRHNSHPFGTNLIRACRGAVYFIKSPAGPDPQLWKTDGTIAGTAMVRDLQLDGVSGAGELTVAGDSLYFLEDAPSVASPRLFKSDGTSAPVLPIHSGASSGGVTAGTHLFFIAPLDPASGSASPTGLWVTDGTVEGTTSVFSVPSGIYSLGELTDVNGTLFFRGYSPDTGEEHYRSDGTPGGTHLVADLMRGPLSSSPAHLANIDGTLYFSAGDHPLVETDWYTHLSVSDFELYKSDGTATGTIRVKDINPGVPSSDPDFFLPIAGAALFAARTKTNGMELWRSDGTEAGTALVKDINLNTRTGVNSDLFSAGSVAYFSSLASDSSVMLWKTDGTPDGSVPIRLLAPSAANPDLAAFTYIAGPSFLASLNGITLFNFGGKLWQTDGTTEGTHVFAQTAIPTDEPYTPVQLGNTLFYAMDIGVFGRELMKTDGTGGGTDLVKDIEPGGGGSNPFDLFALNGKLYFEIGSGSHTGELWTSDGTAAGTVSTGVVLIHSGFSGPTTVPLVVNNRGYFLYVGNTGTQLWATDGTPAGTFDTHVEGRFPAGSQIYLGGSAGQRLVLNVFDPSGSQARWSTDGTPAGTQLVVEPSSVAFGRWHYYIDYDYQNYRLYRSDGTPQGTTILLTSTQRLRTVQLNGRLLIVADPDTFHAAQNVARIYIVDANTGGIHLQGELDPGESVPDSLQLAAAGQAIVVVGVDGKVGREVFRISLPSAVVGRQIFYNNSAFDGNSSDANAADDSAIAPDKVALLPGEAATFTNYTSYSKGINGIMIDLGGRSPTALLTAADFGIRVGNSDDTSAWSNGPAPTITLRRGAGMGGSDRVELTWPDFLPKFTPDDHPDNHGSIGGQWLQVTVKANADTGLVDADVFYFGNAPADEGDSAAKAFVNATDEIGPRSQPHNLFNPAQLTDAHDYNRDKQVDATDQIIARLNGTNFLTALKLITLHAVADNLPSSLYLSAAHNVASVSAEVAGFPKPANDEVKRVAKHLLN